mmetsp:Transcript_17771/g.23933  ORF Transcript_17771/g.23933 Transcript_17771/m.23933 type:complete len:204 (+) Transcript_17771:120-731(+)
MGRAQQRAATCVLHKELHAVPRAITAGVRPLWPGPPAQQWHRFRHGAGCGECSAIMPLADHLKLCEERLLRCRSSKTTPRPDVHVDLGVHQQVGRPWALRPHSPVEVPGTCDSGDQQEEGQQDPLPMLRPPVNLIKDPQDLLELVGILLQRLLNLAGIDMLDGLYDLVSGDMYHILDLVRIGVLHRLHHVLWQRPLKRLCQVL